MKTYFFRLAQLIIAGLMAMGHAGAREDPADSLNIRENAVRIFIDCSRCDMDYIRREIPYVNYVRDVMEAQVYVLETRQRTGSGGYQYTFTFEGQEDFAGMVDTLVYTASPDDTDETERQGRTQMLKMGLMRYVAQSPLYDQVSIRPARDLETQEVIDRWNNWVFELRASPQYDAQETRKDLNLFTSISAVKVTHRWKLEHDYDLYYRKTKYIIDDSLYNRHRSSHRFDNLVVKSLGAHWSVGARAELRSSTYRNTEFSVDFLPSIEYDIFPYSESTHRQLRILYGIGNSYRVYNDTTIYGKMSESLFQQQLRIALQVQEKWGSVNVSLEGMNFLHDFSKNRLELGGYMEVRIIKGLSVRVYGEVARIRDQLSLPKEDASEADILLRLQELETGYEINSYISVTYTFGSIYNNIVNPRFGNGRRRRR